jgi:hypothetical protein
MSKLTLRDAIERWQREPHAPANAYEWYRQGAHHSGHVYLGPLTIPAFKTGGTWFVDDADLSRAISVHRRQRAEVLRATEDLRSGALHGADGEQIETEWGHYTRRDPFHFRWSAYEAGRHRSDGAWYCNTCMRPADTEHSNLECHRCSDWGSCGNDCTLSRIFCATCDASLRFGPVGADLT